VREHLCYYSFHIINRGQALPERQNQAVNAGGIQNRNNRGPVNAGRRRANNNRMCSDCEVAMAIAFCGECNPPLCLCDNCWMTLHRGATRRNHQRRGELLVAKDTIGQWLC